MTELNAKENNNTNAIRTDNLLDEYYGYHNEMAVTTQVDLMEELLTHRIYHVPNKVLQDESSVFHNFNAMFFACV